ncbi:hypothetical protein [Paenibacillus terrigena]|uniref:hypothetical protein n=1 Tax=Paenibacillus terrigena TaxID=369333 RepID=UPI000477BD13|nr:hypothetical protein [Paenibacillus terrigena]
MDRPQPNDRHADLKYYAAHPDKLPPIDLTDRVMAKVRNLQSSPKRFRSMKRSSVLLTAIILTLVASVTAYAAAEYIQIRNAKGKVVMRTAQYWPPLPPDHNRTVLSSYDEQVRGTLKQGQLVAYYIDNPTLNAYDRNLVKLVYKNEFKHYDDYVQEMKRTSTPRLLQPDRLPKGYEFSLGQVVPSFLFGDDPEYKELLNRFIARAESSKGKEKLFTEELDWKTSGTAMLIYQKDENNYLYLIASKAIGSTMTQPKGAKAEQLTIDGQDLIYIDNRNLDTKVSEGKNKMGWFNEKTNVAYNLYDSASSDLTKQDFIAMAKSIIEHS